MKKKEEENWDLYLSQDGGVQWEELQADLATSQLSYQWTVPEVETQQAQIRIHMDNTGTDYDDASGDFTIRTPLPVHDQGTYPPALVLASNYPNPFNPATTIHYNLPVGMHIRLTVYDLIGREVAGLADGYKAPGYYQAQWDGKNHIGREVPSGVYIARLVTSEYTKSIKMALLK